jgi:hypothetical protein
MVAQDCRGVLRLQAYAVVSSGISVQESPLAAEKFSPQQTIGGGMHS